MALTVHVAVDDGASAYYRARAPFAVLSYCTDHRFRFEAVTVAHARDRDVLWLQQATQPQMEDMVDAFHAHGKRVVYDVDDLLFELPLSWPCYSDYFHSGRTTAYEDYVEQQVLERLVYHARLIGKADAVTAPTARLADAIRRHTGRDAVILPNCIKLSDWDMISPVATKLDGPVLGWFGSENHWDDWMEIVDAVDEALDEVGGHLALLGAPYLLRMFPERLSARTHIQNLVSMRNFGEMRRMIMAFDVGLAWCTDRLEANRCRSPLKALQYGAAGVPCVASQTVYGENLPGWGEETYHDFGITANAEDLYDVLVDALTTPRLDAAARWRDEVGRSWSYERNATQWLEVLE